MFNPTHIHSTNRPNDENAVAAMRTGKPSHPNGKPTLAPATPAATKKHSTPMRLALTPSTPGIKRVRSSTPMQAREPMRMVKKSRGLFSPYGVADERVLLLEPEYVPERAASPELAAVEEFGDDLDATLVPGRPRAPHVAVNVGGALELAPERMQEICVPTVRFSRIPKPCGSAGQIKVRLQELLAMSLYPTRIPRLKRKRV
ncbi:hypothetical protein EC988_000349 [Linderina pennispora]|nr:hypothetical protein EC988_000349 [Linderina pennispora]